MTRTLLETLDLKSEGSFIDAEMVIKAKNLGFVIQQLGLDYFPRTRGNSTLSSPAVIVKILREMIRLYPEIRRPKKKDPVSGPSAASQSVPPSEVLND